MYADTYFKYPTLKIYSYPLHCLNHDTRIIYDSGVEYFHCLQVASLSLFNHIPFPFIFPIGILKSLY